MTTSYRKHEPVEPEEVRPVAVRSPSAPQPKPKNCMTIVVERIGLIWWFLRGVSMGGGFAVVWYGLQAIQAVI